MRSTDVRYWAEYDGLQHAKHQLLKGYLKGWFPILSSSYGRVLYIDCHAGRGRHATGHKGSPILALELLLQHKLRDRILASTEVHFFFFEIDQYNYDCLCSEIEKLGELPANIHVHTHQEDYERSLRSAIQELRAESRRMAPSFAFIDPYGFSISMDLLNQLLAFPACELLISFMYRYVDMALHRTSQSDNMDTLFATSKWRELVAIEHPRERANETIALFSSQLAAEYVTHMNLIGENNALKYVLIHATNHAKGRELMKEAMWAVMPEGTFTAHERRSPNQLVLIVPEPDLYPLEEALISTFAGEEIRMDELYTWLTEQVYLKKHLHQVLRNLHNQGRVTFYDCEGRFAFSRNPVVRFG